MTECLKARIIRQNLSTKVAIVQENVTFRRYLADLISRDKGCSYVCACASAEEAVAEIPSHKPDVVLLDARLPGASGVAYAAHLHEKLPNVQIIMLTASKDIKTVLLAFKAGAVGYLLKRAGDREILNAIAEARSGGAPMSKEIARMVVRSFSEPARSTVPDVAGKISEREMEILALLAEGFPNKEIAARLFISRATVRTHLMHIYEKLHVRSRTEAAAKYHRSYLVVAAK
jgi:DNA-binding NarL/FixJ family response regulator